MRPTCTWPSFSYSFWRRRVLTCIRGAYMCCILCNSWRCTTGVSRSTLHIPSFAHECIFPGNVHMECSGGVRGCEAAYSAEERGCGISGAGFASFTVFVQARRGKNGEGSESDCSEYATKKCESQRVVAGCLYWNDSALICDILCRKPTVVEVACFRLHGT